MIFSTAYEQFAVEAFRLEAMDYLLKPVERDRLEETVGRARRMVADRITEPVAPVPAPANPAFTKLLLRSGARNLIVDPQELIYATIDSGVITLVTSQVEGQSNFRTLEELLGRARPRRLLARAPVIRRQHQPDPRSGTLVQVDLPVEDG